MSRVIVFVFVALSLCVNPQTASFAADYTDTQGPILTAKVLQAMPSRGNAVVFEITAQDAKNEISNKSSVENINSGRFLAYGTYNKSSNSLAPACYKSIEKSNDYVAMQLIPLQEKSIQLPNGWYESKFIAIFYFEKMSALPAGCPEWRQGLYFFFSQTIQDAVGNRSLLIDDAPPWQTGKAALSPFTKLLDPNLASNTSRYCWMPPYTAAHRKKFLSSFNQYLEQVEIHRSNSYAQDILNIFDKNNPNYAQANSYLMLTQDGFSLKGFNELPLCMNSSILSHYNLPSSAPDELSFFNTVRELSRAKALDNERIAEEAKAKAVAEAEAKAKAVAEAKLLRKEEAEARAEARAAKKTAAPTRKTISCFKGKSIKKITKKDSKCPSGYKLR